MSRAAHGLSASIQARLIQHARALDFDVTLVLTRFAIERFLYRLSRSSHRTADGDVRNHHWS